MISENQEAVVDAQTNEELEVESISIPKKDYENLNQTLGSLKRELKDLKKSKDEPKETTIENKTDNPLIEKAYLRAAGITDAEEVELARATAKKWNMGLDEVVDDGDFKIKLDKLRTQKSNELATTNIKGGQGGGDAKNTPEYWISKGIPPTRDQVPDRKTRAKIARAMMANAKSGKKFYNE